MPRAATGQHRFRDDKWIVRVTLGPKLRPEYVLPTCRTEDEVIARKAILARAAERLRKADHLAIAPELLRKVAEREGKPLAEALAAIEAVCAGQVESRASGKTSGPVTFRKFAEQWTSGKLARLHPDHIKVKRSVTDDVERLEKHVYPLVEDVPIDRFTLEQAEAVMRALPSTLSPATRRHVAQVIHRVLALAVYPARVRESNPLPRGFLPKPGAPKAKSYLYPDEDAALLAKREVPLPLRVLFGFLAREGMRYGEACNLRWSDVDLARGVVKLDENKTDDPRAWPLDPGVSRALSAWHKLRGKPAKGEHVFTDQHGRPLDDRSLAPVLRSSLASAGVKRPELDQKTTTRIRLRVHDLRATFVTVSLANGRTESWVTDRTGHDLTSLETYRRQARTLRDLHLGALAPLDEAIPELRDERGGSPEKARRGREKGGTSSDVSADGRAEAEKPEGAQAETPGGALGSAAARHPGSTPGSCTAFSAPLPGADDAIDAALARALDLAVERGDLDRVAVVVAELRERRQARDGVTTIGTARDRREAGR